MVKQLCLAIVNGDTTFLNSPLNSTHKNVIFISTEEGKAGMADYITRQNEVHPSSNFKGMRFSFDTVDPVGFLQKQLEKQKADLIVLDVWSDVYLGDPNNFSKVRENLKKYSELAEKYETCVCIIHHLVKTAYTSDPHKSQLNGSQAIEAKLRTLLDLRPCEGGDDLSALSAVKGNYISKKTKKERLLIRFEEETLSFSFVKKIEKTEGHDKKKRNPKSGNLALVTKALELNATNKYTQDKMVEILKEEFPHAAPSKGKLNQWLQMAKKGLSASEIVSILSGQSA